MTILLDILYTLLALTASPVILFKWVTSARWRAGFAERLGGGAVREGEKPCIWIHTVSVGEFNAARPLMDLIAREHPDWDLRVSTTTNTGQKLARERLGPERCRYFPLDFSWAVARAFRRVRPSAIVLMELELWPDFLRAARRRGVPVLIANGRMREKWVKVYRSLRPLFAPALDPATGNVFCVQNETYRDRFARAGFPAPMLRVAGNMKYDAVRSSVDPAKVAEIRSALGLAEGEPVWVAGCTWPGEEAICLRAHRQLQKEMPSLRLAIAPRHIERANDVAREITQAGYRCRRRSDGKGEPGPEMVGLLDTIGELGYLYSFAELVFVGKSLTDRGGHNVLEPAALGVMPVFGPFTDNFREEAALLLEAGAAECIANEQELCAVLLRLLRDPAGRRRRVEAGRQALLAHRGASSRHLEVLQSFLAVRSRA